jgi:hypothetical protein
MRYLNGDLPNAHRFRRLTQYRQQRARHLPAPEDVLRLWSADKRVGNVKNNGPELLKMGDMGPEQPALL